MTTIGAQISSIKAYMQTENDVYESFEKIAKSGYRIVQNQWINPDIDPNIIADAMKRSNLTCVSTQDYFDVVATDFENVIETNRIWGSQLVCVSGIPDTYVSVGYDGILEFAKVLTRMTERLRDNGMELSFHPRYHEYGIIAGKTMTELLLDHTPNDCQLGLDLYHLKKAGEDPVKWIDRFAGRMDFVHFKDSINDSSGNEILMPVGQGGYDWTSTINAAITAGVKWGFAEQERWQKDAFICMRESFEYLTANGLQR